MVAAPRHAFDVRAEAPPVNPTTLALLTTHGNNGARLGVAPERKNNKPWLRLTGSTPPQV
jgi:hypothetical protein